MKRTNLYAEAKICRVTYVCPHCHERVDYETDGLPPKGECHKCLKPIKFNVILLDGDTKRS